MTTTSSFLAVCLAVLAFTPAAHSDPGTAPPSAGTAQSDAGTAHSARTAPSEAGTTSPDAAAKAGDGAPAPHQGGDTRAKLVIVPRSSWDTRVKKPSTGLKYSGKLKHVLTHIVVHHSDFDPPAGVEGVRDYHLDVNGWGDIGYHFVITTDGTIYEARSLERKGAHAGITKEERNNVRLDPDYGAVGIVLDGRFEDHLPEPAQLESLERLIADLRARFPKIQRVMGHREVRDDVIKRGLTPISAIKTCPGEMFFGWLQKSKLHAGSTGEHFEKTAIADGTKSGSSK